MTGGGATGTDLLGLDGDPAGALGRGGELVGEGLKHGAGGDGVVELLQARLHLRHLGREEAERRGAGAGRATHRRCRPLSDDRGGGLDGVVWIGGRAGEGESESGRG